MAERLRRIMDLSKKTGDTVIVHDATAADDFVVVPFGRYEELVLSPGHDHFDEYLLEEMSERELLDKINRDIAIWRSYQELNTRDKQAALLEDQLAEDPLPDPFEEDYAHRTDWHRVSDLITDRRGARPERDIPKDTEEEEPIHTYIPVQEQTSTPNLPFTKPSFSSNFSSIPPEEIGPGPLIEDESGLDSDDDDAVFFEEPAS